MKAKRAPASRQHLTAGPYSPVLEIGPGRIVVISGQAALDADGNLAAEDFAGQTRVTLENCLTQLRAAECGFADVFKVNVYLTDLANWSTFNDIYSELMPEPRPVRTALQVGLLGKLLVEVDMWAVKS